MKSWGIRKEEKGVGWGGGGEPAEEGWRGGD